MNSTPLHLNWNKASDGLIPAIIQDASTQKVLMLGYFNQASLDETVKTGNITFYSRTRQSLWIKGETSGNFFKLVEIKPDCDQDALLILVNPVGPACHRNTETCFDLEPNEFQFLSELEVVIESRFETPHAHPKSYTVSLINEGLDRMIQKVGEEAIETVIAAKNEDLKDLEGEASDLIFHLMVMLRAKKSSLREVVKRLKLKHK